MSINKKDLVIDLGKNKSSKVGEIWVNNDKISLTEKEMRNLFLSGIEAPAVNTKGFSLKLEDGVKVKYRGMELDTNDILATLVAGLQAQVMA